jgi:uncharacterized protein YutE (UPF0331/DUF86 family)
LRQKFIIDMALSDKLKKMVGFRNTVTHQYQRIDLSIAKAVIVSSLDDLIEFRDRVLAFINGLSS